MNFAFSRPEYLLWLFAIPLVIFLHFITLRLRQSRAIQFANFAAIARVKGVDIYSKNITILCLTILAVLTSTAALSGLTIVKQSNISSFSFVISLDVSRSMEANDILPNRLSAAKSAAHDFVLSLPQGTRMGLITFSGNSYIQQPITDNRENLLRSLDGVQISSIGGTDLAESIISAANLLEKEPTKAIVILSDGQSNVAGLEEALKYSVENKIVIHTIGIGTTEGGNTSYGFSKLDEDVLKSLAYNTGGTYSRTTNLKELTSSLNSIQNLRSAFVTQDISNYCLTATLILLLLIYILGATRYRMFP